MSEDTPNAIYPDAVDVSVTQAGMIALEYDHADAPPIVLSKIGGERLGSQLNRAATVIANYEEPSDG